MTDGRQKLQQSVIRSLRKTGNVTRVHNGSSSVVRGVKLYREIYFSVPVENIIKTKLRAVDEFNTIPSGLEHTIAYLITRKVEVHKNESIDAMIILLQLMELIHSRVSSVDLIQLMYVYLYNVGVMPQELATYIDNLIRLEVDAIEIKDIVAYMTKINIVKGKSK